MKKYLLFFIAAMSATIFGYAQTEPWTLLSISPAQVVSLEKYNHLFMINTTNMGAYYSDDYGIYWKKRTPDPNVPSGVGSVNYKGKTIILGTYKASYSYTLDQWMPIPTLNGSSWNRIKVSGNKVYVAGGYQYFMYSSDGEKFNRLYMNIGSANTRDIEDFDTLKIATLGDSYLYRSTDAGATWTQFGGEIPGKKMRLYRYFDKLFLTLSPTGVYKSLDSGATWNKVDYFEDESIVSSEFADDIIYFAGSNHGIHISADSGYNWMPINKGLYNTNTNFVRQIGDILYSGLSMVNIHGVVDKYFYSTVVNFINPLAIRIESVGKRRMCQGDTMSIYFTVLSPDRDSSDIITLALSDSSGNLSHPIHIDSLGAGGQLSFKFFASRNFPPSENYKLLVKSYSPHRKPQTDPDTINIAILANPKAALPELPWVCNSDERILLTSGQPAGGYYKGYGVEDSVYFNPRNVGPGEHHITYYSVNPEGCRDSAENIIKVFYSPAKPIINVIGDTLMSNVDFGNQWFRDSVALEGEIGKVIDTKNVEGYYSVQISDGKCKSLMSDPVFVKDKSLSEITPGLRISPNPASNFVRVYFGSSDGAKAKITVINALGQVVISTEALGDHGARGVDLNLENLSDGVYLLNLEAGAASQTMKLCVAR